jgi:hypothetical protein
MFDVAAPSTPAAVAAAAAVVDAALITWWHLRHEALVCGGTCFLTACVHVSFVALFGPTGCERQLCAAGAHPAAVCGSHFREFQPSRGGAALLPHLDGLRGVLPTVRLGAWCGYYGCFFTAHGSWPICRRSVTFHAGASGAIACCVSVPLRVACMSFV